MQNSEAMYNFSSKLWYNKRHVSAAGDASIYLQVVINGAHKEFPLKLRWPIEKIDLVHGVLMPRKKRDSDVDDYNLIVATEQAKHTEILRTYRLRRAPIDIKKFSRELQTFDNKESFIGYMLRQVRYRYETKDIDPRTYRNVRSTIVLMMQFDAVWRYENLTTKFMNQFKNWLRQQEYAEGKIYAAGQIWTKIRDIKAYMRLASKEPLIHVENEVIDYPNPLPRWRTNYLTRSELAALVKVYRDEYMSTQRYQVLSAFLFTCFTSLRISDVYRVNSEWRLDENYLDFIPKKGEKKRRRLKVPIMPMAFQFIYDVSGRFFNLPTEQEYNRELKDIAKMAGLGKRLTSHVGRHTFGYLYMTSIGNLKGLQEIMGHSKSTTTERYAHLDDEYKLDSVKLMQKSFTDILFATK